MAITCIQSPFCFSGFYYPFILFILLFFEYEKSFFSFIYIK